MALNQRWYVHKRPLGDRTASDFALREEPVPDVKPGEVLIRKVSISLDPATRQSARERAKEQCRDRRLRLGVLLDLQLQAVNGTNNSKLLVRVSDEPR
jgi:hypothetical protein